MNVKTILVAIIACLIMESCDSSLPEGEVDSKRDDPDAANWNIALLDTAAKADFLSGVEKDVILEMNKARSDPKKYAELYIQPLGNKSGAQSCVADLSQRQRMGLLKLERGLFLAAKYHVNDTGPKGTTGHTGSDGSSPFDRMDRYGKWDGFAGENISYGHNVGRDIVVQLLIDDGLSPPGHRDNILDQNYKYAGAAIGNHSKYTYMCVIDYANTYTSN
jgi:hypothetical protein